MTAYDYDVITIGGGLGGTALAKTLSERGHRVLVLERTTEFTDRVRGEVLVPWGCAEAAKLGLYDLLHDRCAHGVCSGVAARLPASPVAMATKAGWPACSIASGSSGAFASTGPMRSAIAAAISFV